MLLGRRRAGARAGGTYFHCVSHIYVRERRIPDRDSAMKREQFIRELRKLARDTNKTFEVFEDRGKGSHYRVRFDGRMSTVKSGDLTPAYMRLARRSLTMRYVYNATLTADPDGGYLVTFSDVPEAITAGDTPKDALANAREALGLALRGILADGRQLPRPEAEVGTAIAVDPDIA
eukprot:gene57107-78247_t